MAYTRTTWRTGETPLSAGNMNNIEDGIEEALAIVQRIAEIVYPVGCYFETSDTSFDPNVTFGGTWILEAAGQVHVSAGPGYAVSGALTNTTDGGNKNAIVPSHRHSVAAVSEAITGGSHNHSIYYRTGTNIGNGSTGWWVLGSSNTHTGSNSNTVISSTHSHNLPAHNTNYEGTSATNANMQPYIVVNRWHRTA